MIIFFLLKSKSLECTSNSEVKHFAFQFKELCKDNIQTHSVRALFNFDTNMSDCSRGNRARKCQHLKFDKNKAENIQNSL